jgi:hypothetical protein
MPRALKKRVVEMAPRPAADEQQISLALVATPDGPNLSAEDREEAMRRLGVIEPLLYPERTPLLTVQYPTRAAMIAYLAKAHKVLPRQIYRWLAAFRRDGMAGLVRRDRADKGKPKVFNAAALELLLRAALPQKGVIGRLSVAEIVRLYEEERVWREAHVGKKLGEFDQAKYARYTDEDGRLRPSALLPKASYGTFLNWFDRIPEAARVMARDGDEAFRNAVDVISHRDLAAIDPMDYVVMDHRCLDVFALFPVRGGWRLTRPWLTAAIDMRTRRWLGWVIVETPSSDSIAAVLKQVFIHHGIPKAVYWDNGKDFRCHWFEGREARSADRVPAGELDTAWRGVLGTLDIRVHHAIPYNARAKIIEPNFGRISKFDQTLPEWCGHKPGARPEHYQGFVDQHEAWAAGARESTPFRTVYDVAALYDAAIEDLNERPLEGEGMNKATPTGRGWMCPNEAWEILIRRVARREVPLDVLQFCFAKRKQLAVRHCELQTTVNGRVFRYRVRREDRQRLLVLEGQTCELAYDPLDMGEAVVYFDGRCVGLADCVELRRMGEDAFREDEADRRAVRREVKSLIARVHQAVPIATADERLVRRRAVRPARVEEQRAIEPAAVLPEIAAAAELARADREFKFADAAGEIETVEPAVAAGDGKFDFFS